MVFTMYEGIVNRIEASSPYETIGDWGELGAIAKGAMASKTIRGWVALFYTEGAVSYRKFLSIFKKIFLT